MFIIFKIVQHFIRIRKTLCLSTVNIVSLHSYSVFLNRIVIFTNVLYSSAHRHTHTLAHIPLSLSFSYSHTLYSSLSFNRHYHHHCYYHYYYYYSLQLEGIEDGKGTGVQIITLNPIIGASHWLALDKFITQRSVASWSDAAMDMYHYTILTQEVGR